MRVFLSELIKNDIHVNLIDGELSVKFPKNWKDMSLLEEIKSRKKDIIDYLSALKGNMFAVIPVLAITENFPISDAQRRLWILSQFEGGSVAYNIPGNLQLNQDIDIESFKKAIENTIDRHEILRTVFREDDKGEVRQWILKKEDLGFEIEYNDLRKEKNKQEKVKAYIDEDSYKAFNLEKGPLLRACLLQVEEESYVFYYNMHHIISDGWSMEVLRKDVFSYYEAYKENKEPQLKELRIQYKDYSAWQLAQHEEESFKAHKDYWLESLSGVLPLLDLPSSKQRPRLKTHNGKGLSAYIDPETTGKLKKYAETNGGSLFMSLLAAWNVLLYRYTSQKDIIIGTPIAGRAHADLEDQIGFYVNTLALRNEIKPEENFNDFYSALKDNTLKSYSHQMYPFDRLVEELNLHRDTSRSPVFDIMLALQNNGEKIDGLELKMEELNQVEYLGHTTSKFDMDINVQETGDYLALHVIYNSDVYEQKIVESLIKHFRQLLKALLENPAQKISQIDYLSQLEKHELLITFNDTQINYPKDKTILALFEQQAETTSSNLAVVFEGRKLTYKELDEKSNQLAHYLQKNYNISPDELVGIKQGRSEWMIISILGVLKAGGAYVPIDPEYPQDRIDYIEKDTKCKICIDEKELVKFKKNQRLFSKKKIKSHIRPNNLAYVIYTSGSTGKPKGVMIEHRNLINYLIWYTENFKVVSTDSTMAYANFGFDASVGETLTYLIKGACVHIAPKELLLDVDGINEYYESNNITIAFLPTPVCQQFMHLKNKSLRCLTTGGDRLIQFVKNGYQLINNYGPTETTVVSTTYKVNEPSQSYPIGRPIYNTEVYILSENLNLLPNGVVGEIFIGGIQIARGYLNKESLTAEKFITNPFKHGERLYKTGDLGKWLSDGNIEFIGRKDDQVKIRGYRIELGEIEHALQSNKEIEEAVVIARENQANEKELVAYITSKKRQEISNLRSYLKVFLPEYMLPVYYVQMEKLPLNNNGKVDKKILPDPQFCGIKSSVEYVGPKNKIEEKLVKIWEKILQRDNIGVKDDFFAIGGSSIKTIQACREYKFVFNRKVSLNFFISNPIISEHAEYIAHSLNESTLSEMDLIDLNTFSKTNQNMIMIPPVQGESIYFLGFSKFIENYYNCYGINYLIDHDFKSLIDISKYYAELIIKQSFNNTAKLYIMGFSMGAAIAFEIVKVLEDHNYVCELFLFDRFPNTKSFFNEMAKVNSDKDEIWLDQQISIATKISPEENITSIKKRIVNNYELLSNYETKGKIKSNISCLEASTKELTFNMKSWKKYTHGQFRLEKIESPHDEIFNERNYDKLYSFIQQKQD